MSRLETEVFAADDSLRGLRQLNAEWVDRAMMRTWHQRIIVDMDSLESPDYGEREGATYNGDFGSACAIARCSISTNSAIVKG